MPVEDVELDHRHAVQRPLDHLDRLEVPAHIQQQPPPPEPRRILDMHRRDEPALPVPLEQLQQRLEAPQCAHGGGRPEQRPSGIDIEGVRLVLLEARHGRPRSTGGDQQRRGRAVASDGARQCHAAAALQPLEHSDGRRFESWIGPWHRHPETGIEGQPALVPLHGARNGQQAAGRRPLAGKDRWDAEQEAGEQMAGRRWSEEVHAE
jgi:hypothetical protein